MKFSYPRATQIAATIGQMAAILMGFVGLLVFHNPWFIFIALFVWIGASQESGYVQTKWALSGVPIERLMITEFRALAPNDTLSAAADHVLAGFQHDFPVTDDGRVVGVLTRTDLMKALTRRDGALKVGDVMSREFKTATPDEMAEKAFARLQQGQCPSLPVLRDGKLVGIVTLENVGEYLMIQRALGREG